LREKKKQVKRDWRENKQVDW